MAAARPRTRLFLLSNLNLRSESLNTVKEQAILLEKIFFYNDVFSLDNGCIPNLAYFNSSKADLESAWPTHDEDAKSVQVNFAELKKSIGAEMKQYFDLQGDRQLKVAIFCLAQFILCLPFLFNYFEP